MFPKEAPGNFATLRSRMRLVQDGVDGLSNADMSYVTSGYAPLTGRLVQAVLTQGGVSQGGRLLGLSRRDREDPERAGAGNDADGGAPAAGAGHAEEGGAGGADRRRHVHGAGGDSPAEASGGLWLRDCAAGVGPNQRNEDHRRPGDSREADSALSETELSVCVCCDSCCIGWYDSCCIGWYDSYCFDWYNSYCFDWYNSYCIG